MGPKPHDSALTRGRAERLGSRDTGRGKPRETDAAAAKENCEPPDSGRGKGFSPRAFRESMAWMTP